MTTQDLSASHRFGDATMLLRTTGCVLVVFLWSLTGVQGKDQVKHRHEDQVKQVCALKGSFVVLPCPIPSWTWVTEMVWYKSRLDGESYDLRWDPGYAGRVEYQNDCSLKITDLRETDQATYYFVYKTENSAWTVGSHGYTVSLTDLKVEVSHQRYGGNTLTCSTTCTLPDNPTFTWYKNGQYTLQKKTPMYVSDSGSYYCATDMHQGLHSPAVCVSNSNCWSVTYTKRTMCVLKGSSVDISCSYTHPSHYTQQGSFWFTKMDSINVALDSNYRGRVTYNNRLEMKHTVTINNLRESDSAKYTFRLLTKTVGRFSGHPGTILTVTDVLLEMFPTTVSEGNRLTLRCKTKCTMDPLPKYIWYKDGQRITSPVTSSNRLILDPVSRENAGRYSCGVEGPVDLRSVEETLIVMYGPKNASVSVSPSGEIVEGSSVTLTCSSDANPPVYKYTWYKKNVTSSKASGQSYSITNITSEDSGEYYCEAENEYGRLNSSLSVNVYYGPKNPSVSVSPSGEIVEGSSVTLTCSSDANPPVDKYTWYKKNVTSPKASGQSYNITKITSEDSGEYYCEVRNGRGSKNSTDLTLIVAGNQTSVLTASVGITVFVLVLILCLSGFIWFRKKDSKFPSDTTNQPDDGQGHSSPVYENILDKGMTSSAAQTPDKDNQDVLLYASVHYSTTRDQEVPLNSTVQIPQPQKQEEEVQYAALAFNSSNAATRAHGAEGDLSVFFSTVNSPRNTGPKHGKT